MSKSTPVSITLLAEFAGVHRNTVVRDIEKGVLPAERAGATFTIDHDVAQDYIAARKLYEQADAALAGVKARAQERIATRAR